MKNSKTRAMAESAILFVIAYVLSLIPHYEMPQGGSVTALSMLPLLLIGIRQGAAWGVGSCILYGAFQLLPPVGMGITILLAWTKTPRAFIIALLLDYIIAFGALGFSFLFRRSKAALLYAVPVCLALRFLCHFLSGIVVWYDYAEDMAVWIYSLIYNGSYMGVELALTMAAAFALWKAAPGVVNNEP